MIKLVRIINGKDEAKGQGDNKMKIATYISLG